MINCNQQQPKNMLELNYDCQFNILKILPPIDLCAVAGTCTHLKHVASDAFKFQIKSSRKYYAIRTNDEKWPEQHPILKKFGNTISKAHIIDHMYGSTWKLAYIFDWLEKYCAGTLQKLYIDSSFVIVLSPPVARLLSTLKQLRLNASFYTENLSIALSNCKKLVYLHIHLLEQAPESSLYLWDNHFPHLKSLKCGWINTNDDLNKMERFFQNHAKLSVLSMHFYNSDEENANRIDLSFLQHLPDLEELDLYLNTSKVDGIDALTRLQNLKKLAFGNSTAEICTAILNSIASVTSLVTLTFYIGRKYLHGSGRVFQSIKHFNNLSTLIVKAVRAHEFEFSSLDTKQIIDVVRNLHEIKRVELDCRFKFEEYSTFFDDLVKVGSSQKRKIVLLINVKNISRRQLKLFIKFNREHGAFVEIREKIQKL